MTTNDKIKAVVEEFEEEFAPFIGECFHYDTGHSIAPLARKQKKWLQHRLETLVREEREEWETYQDQVESIFNWLQGENGDFPDLSQKPHYRFRSELRKLRATLNPPITNNKN